jgi:hypothetical protein
MTNLRQIRKVFKSKPTIEGAGVHLRRAFGYDEVALMDPFLLFDDFRSEVPEEYQKGFPWHPHRGIAAGVGGTRSWNISPYFEKREKLSSGL